MTESENPYQSPAASQLEDESKSDPSNFDKRGMLSLIAGASILGGVDYWLLQFGGFVVFGSLILFFVLAFWSVMAGTRGGTKTLGVRIALGVISGVLAAPSFFALLMATCIPATEAAGLGFDIHRGVPAENKFLFGLITTVMIALVGLVLFALTFVIPRALKQPKSQADA